jgi:hypothetical protein
MSCKGSEFDKINATVLLVTIALTYFTSPEKVRTEAERKLGTFSQTVDWPVSVQVLSSNLVVMLTA